MSKKKSKASKKASVQLLTAWITALVSLILAVVFLILFINANSAKNALREDLDRLKASGGLFNMSNIVDMDNGTINFDVFKQAFTESCVSALDGADTAEYVEICRCAADYFIDSSGFFDGIGADSININIDAADIEEVFTSPEFLNTCVYKDN